MFDQAAMRLLEGAFICESSAPSLFRWLDAEGNRIEVDSYLRKIGRQLTETPNGHAYYATWVRIGSEERAEVKRVMMTIKQTVRPVVQFLTLCMDVGQSDNAPSPGDRVDYSHLLISVTENPHLLEKLREFGSFGKEYAVADASPKGMLDRVILQMEKAGYLILLNREQEAYRFTGKLDYYYQLLDFLMENEADIKTDDQADQEIEGGAETRRLL